MVTGASTADLAIVLVDARQGLLEQSRRHAFLASLLGSSTSCSRVNKMDLVDWDQAAIRGDPRRIPRASPPGSMSHDVTLIPMSALHGDNVVHQVRQHALV